jgi:FMN reductase
VDQTRVSEVSGERPYVVGIGGTTRAGSSSQRALVAALSAASDLGADVAILAGEQLDLPMYAPDSLSRSFAARELIRELRRADGVIVSSPGYHGGVSGMVKNALDYVEDLRDDPRPYLDGLAVGCIVCAYGTQAGVTTLAALRSIVHALRGWPTPIGVAINSSVVSIDEHGTVSDPQVAGNLSLLAGQVVDFATHRMPSGALR